MEDPAGVSFEIVCNSFLKEVTGFTEFELFGADKEDQLVSAFPGSWP